jgi:hypothetical protein
MVGGCASDADKINTLVFGAVKKDPLFLWRPEWVIKATDMETPIGGIYPEGAARLSHALKAENLPSSALNDAITVALESGWQVPKDGVGYVKAIANSTMKLWVLFSVTMETNVITMTFSGQSA